MKLEVVVIPVSDVDHAKEFYARLGWRLDRDFRFANGLWAVQFTPPSSQFRVLGAFLDQPRRNPKRWFCKLGRTRFS